MSKFQHAILKKITRSGKLGLKDGKFSHQSNEYVWDSQSGLKKAVVLEPALPDSNVLSPKAEKIRFAWGAPDNQTSDQVQFIPTFKNSRTFEIVLNSFLSFGNDGEIQFKPIKEKVEVVSLESLVDYYVNPRSFVMTIGDTLPFDFVIKAKESPPPPPPVPTAKQNEIILLNGAYSLTLENVDWSYIFNGQQSEVFSGLIYQFTPTNIGYHRVIATATCRLDEISIPTKKRRGWFSNLFGLSDGPVEQPKIEFFVNDKPLGSETYHLGQKINLTYKLTKTDGLAISAEKQEWNIQEPLPALLIVDDPEENEGKMIPIDVGQYSLPKIIFHLFDWDENITNKKIVLTYQWAGKSFPEETSISYQRPTIEKLDPLVNEEPDLFQNEKGDWVMGFKTVEPNEGIQVFGDIRNPTDVGYKVGGFQLIRLDNQRELEDQGKNFRQVQKTVPPDQSPYLESQFWLDTMFKLDNEKFHFPVAPGQTLEKTKLEADSPLYALMEKAEPTWNGVSYKANSSFVIFVMAKPDYFDTNQGVWCPIKVLIWSWGGEATYDKTINNWVKLENSLFVKIPEVSNRIFFPDWKNKVLSGGEPKWRNLK